MWEGRASLAQPPIPGTGRPGPGYVHLPDAGPLHLVAVGCSPARLSI